jgi:hypothetical protein
MASAQIETNQRVGGVFVRWRPMRPAEIQRGDSEVIRTSEINAKTNLTSINIPNDSPPKVNAKFNFGGRKRPNLHRRGGWNADGFGGVLEENDTNQVVYERAIQPFVQESVLKGSPGCCFAYGMTGSGKTHTLLGYEEETGMYLLAARDIFTELETINNETNLDLFLNVRFVELYNKRVYDLLNDRHECNLFEGRNGEVLLRNTHQDENGLYISQGLVGRSCRNWQQVAEAIQVGLQLRTAGNSTVHEHSSRSHAIIEMEIVTEDLISARDSYAQNDAQLTKFKNEGNPKWRKLDKASVKIKKQVQEEENRHPSIAGCLAFCDLAGAEVGSDVVCVGDEYISNGLANRQTEQERLEARQINMSLMSLAEVLKNSNSGRKHVGYRGSPLTLYLRQFLQNKDCKSLMMATVSPSSAFKKRTVQTLRYAKLLAENNSEKIRKNKKRKIMSSKRKKKIVATPACAQEAIVVEPISENVQTSAVN